MKIIDEIMFVCPYFSRWPTGQEICTKIGDLQVSPSDFEVVCIKGGVNRMLYI